MLEANFEILNKLKIFEQFTHQNEINKYLPVLEPCKINNSLIYVRNLSKTLSVKFFGVCLCPGMYTKKFWQKTTLQNFCFKIPNVNQIIVNLYFNLKFDGFSDEAVGDLKIFLE